MLENIADIFQEFVEHPETNEGPYDNVELVRLTNEPPENPHPYVTYFNYHDDTETLATVSQRLLEYADPVEQTRVSETPQPQPYVGWPLRHQRGCTS
jgi:hypothetical protein